MQNYEVRGERLLILAILRRAILDCALSQKRTLIKHQKTVIYWEVQQWMRSPSMVPFSFLWCCDMVNANPDTVRELARRADEFGDGRSKGFPDTFDTIDEHNADTMLDLVVRVKKSA